ARLHLLLSRRVVVPVTPATAAARQASTAAGQSNPAASQSNTTASPFSTPNSPFNGTSPFNTNSSPFNTTSPFNSPASQTKTTKPGESVERQLPDDQKLRQWALDANVPDDVKRLKVCRVEDVCRMRFKDGETPRMRVRNLVVPLRYDDENISVSDAFTRQVREALDNLQDKRNVTVRFIGYTDNAPLTDHDQQIYGDHLALSKARAQRVAMAMQGNLGSSISTIERDGRGNERPVASNDTVQGRALNRRIEVEFWYDDVLQSLPDEPQLC